MVIKHKDKYMKIDKDIFLLYLNINNDNHKINFIDVYDFAVIDSDYIYFTNDFVYDTGQQYSGRNFTQCKNFLQFQRIKLRKKKIKQINEK